MLCVKHILIYPPLRSINETSMQLPLHVIVSLFKHLYNQICAFFEIELHLIVGSNLQNIANNSVCPHWVALQAFPSSFVANFNIQVAN